MTFPVWIELVCATCAATTSGRFTFSGQVPVRKLRQQAKEEGFIFIYNEVFCCKECSDKYDEDCNK